MPRIVVTGAGGFLGARVAAQLAGGGHEVIALARSKLPQESIGNGSIALALCDLTDTASIASLGLTNIDGVVHCAGLSSNWGPRGAFERNNVAATANLLAQARQWGAPHFVFVSSSSVYFRFKDQLDVGENAVLPPPVNHYVGSKIAAERLVRAATDLPYTIVRPRGIYGKGDKALLPRLVKAAQRGPLPSFRGGQSVIDLTHVDDVVAAIAFVLARRNKAAGAIYNVSGGEAVSVREIIRRSGALAGVDVRWREMPWPLARVAIGAIERFHKAFRPAVEPTVTAYSAGLLAFSQTLDLSAIRRDIGWMPKISFDEGLRRTFTRDGTP